MHRNSYPFIALLLMTLLLMTLMAGLASAQTPGGQLYTFVAPGGVAGGNGASATMHYGFGGEGFVYDGLSVGGEIGYAASLRRQSQGLGIASGNGSYHFKNSSGDGRLVPFITGGYSVLFRSAAAHGFNFGGGVNYWSKERLGVRLEFRDHVAKFDRPVHFLGFRVGITFR